MAIPADSSTEASRPLVVLLHLGIDPGQVRICAAYGRPVSPSRGIDTRDRLVEPTTERKQTDMLLHNKVAVIYGAGGGIGGAVARAFAREDADVFLTGRQQASVEAIANEIV